MMWYYYMRSGNCSISSDSRPFKLQYSILNPRRNGFTTCPDICHGYLGPRATNTLFSLVACHLWIPVCRGFGESGLVVRSTLAEVGGRNVNLGLGDVQSNS